ncbi:MAG: aminoacyl-tRNA hydrolase [Anaerolineae bacterium]|nr:aminoacyl-tRNA hydrolase [Anaerolineae bacterium]
MSDKTLIAGLGNPGREYKDNRHNVGFQIVDHLAGRHGLNFSRLQNGAFVTTGVIAGCPVVLAKPQQYMNKSGQPVAALQRFYRIPLENILIVYDDLDIPVGSLRLRPGGGAGGHRGMTSLIQHLGSEDFPRLRVGIDRPPGKMDPAAYVLQDFSAEQQPAIESAYDRAVEAIETWLKDGIELAMSRFNGPSPI